MIQKSRLKTRLSSDVLVFLALGLLFVHCTQFNVVASVGANPNEWLIGWQYRKQHNITRAPLDRITLFYDLSDYWITISGNPINRHVFQPIHNTAIVEVNKVVDGATRKYLAYDSDPEGSEIRLYFANDTAGSWTAYSGNPILGPSWTNYRWPSVAYVNGTFHMFLTDLTDGVLERWTSTDGIYYIFKENIKSGINPFNPFIWLDPNDGRWYLYSHDASGGTEYIKVRNATSIEDLGKANDIVVISRAGPIGSPTVAYIDGQYWLLAEIQTGGVWKIVAYYSTTSPSSGFNECYNSPIIGDDEACPMLLLGPDQTKAYLFSDKESSNWHQYTREVYINMTHELLLENLTNYQIKTIAHYGSGSDDGENVYLNGHSRTDFGDVRFTWLNSSSRSEVECDYWMEELKTGESAQFWVKIPEISSKINNTVYIYYGKNDAITRSNGDNTFDFFDDFSGDLSKWTVLGGTWQTQNGVLSGNTTGFGQRLRASGFSFNNHSVHVGMKWISGTYFENGPYVRGQLPNEQINGYMTFLSTWTGDQKNRISKMMGGPYGTTITSQGDTSPSKNVWYDCVFKLYGNRLKSTISPLYSTEISGIDGTFSNGTFCLFSWSASSERVQFDDLYIRKYVEPEPSNGDWGAEKTINFVVIDQAWVSDERADIRSNQTVGFHAHWYGNGSDVVGGSIYVNHTEHVTNSTGWTSLSVSSLEVGKNIWVVTSVNCSGVTMFEQTVQAPNIVWDEIKIVDEGTTKESMLLGDTVTLWYKAVYEYDNIDFGIANGISYVNDSAMSWSTTKNRWEYIYVPSAPGLKTFILTKVHDTSYNLTVIKDVLGAQTVSVWSSPFLIVTNSTISELTFNSTNRTLSFIVSGPSGTVGFMNVTVAKTLVENIEQLKVYRDGSEINYATIDTNYSWLICFSYNHSTHRIVIRLDSTTTRSFVRSPIELVVYAIGGIAIAALAAILVNIKKKHGPIAKRPPPQMKSSSDVQEHCIHAFYFPENCSHAGF